MKRLVSLILSLTAITVYAAPEAQLGGVLRHGNAHEVSVIYTEPVDVISLGNPENYSILPGQIASLRLTATNQGSVLTVNGLANGVHGVLTITNILDTAGETLPPAVLQFDVTDRIWANIGANELGFRAEAVATPTNGFDVFSGGIQQRNEYDDATFVGEQVSGDFEAKVRVEYVEPAGAGAKAGIMIREQLDEGKARPLDPDDPAQAFSRYVELAVSAPMSVLGEANTTHQIWQRAESPGFDTISLTVTNDAPPAFTNAWLRVERVGQQFNMYRSTDGATWLQIGGATFTPELAANVYVGLAFSAQNEDIPAVTELRNSFVAKFRNYEIIPKSTGNLRIEIVDGHAEVAWDSGWILETAPTVLGVWEQAASQQNPLRVDFNEAKRFYRLRK